MKRGDIWTVAGGADYTGKPRPAVIVQSDLFDGTRSVTICPFTTDPTDAPLLRIAVLPDAANGLREPCRVTLDKLVTVPRARLGTRIGRLDAETMSQLGRGIVVFLGLAGGAGP